MNDYTSIIKEGVPFLARIDVRYTVYLKDSFGIYAVKDTNRGISLTIKGNTVDALVEGRFYESELIMNFDKKRNDYTIDILAVYEVEPRDSNEINRLLSNKANYVLGLNQKEIIDEMHKRVELDKHVKKLTGYNMSFKDAKRFVNMYGTKSVQMVEQNPYILLDVTNYISFEECDTIANYLSHNLASSIRIVSAIRETVKEYCNETGHTCCPIQVLMPRVKTRLNYYLNQSEMNEIVKEHSQEQFIDYTVFNFTNIVVIDDVKQCLKTKSPYLFYEFSDSDIESELNSPKNISSFELDSLNTIDVIQNSEVIEYEQNIAKRIKMYNDSRSDKVNKKDINSLIKEYEQKNNIDLTSMQKEAIKNVLEYKHGGFYVINGSAGTGKTTVVKAIIDIYSEILDINKYVITKLLAPTGRASDVLQKSVGLPANTIHKELVYNPDTNDFERKIYNNPILEPLIIVDETSMLDTWLCSKLLDTITNSSKIIFLGDDKQLPSVGPGKVLSNILSVIPTATTLTEVKRQGKTSGILENAINILDCNLITSYNDSRVLYESNINKQIGSVIAGVKSALQHFKNEEIEVLTPMKIGNLGTRNLNRLLQPIFNPDYSKSKMRIKEGTSYVVNNNYYENNLCVGDKVINIKNLYRIPRYSDDKVIKEKSFINSKIIETKMDETNTTIDTDVMNGEIGTIIDIREADTHMKNKDGLIIGTNHVTRIVVKFPSIRRKGCFDYVFYDDNEDALMLAYAITIHKSQGSSWPCTINVISQEHKKLVSNELLYVASTRASTLNCFIVDKNIYASNIDFYLNDRKTFLEQSLKKELR